jgi:hypothetical protein
MKGIKQIGIMNTITGGMAVGIGYSDYRQRVNEGESSGSAFAKSAAEQALWFVPGGGIIMTAKMVADVLPEVAGGIAAGGRAQASKQSQAYRSNFGGNYVDTQNAYTMRQRGVQAIEQNRMNTRSVMGSEARTLFRYANQQ